MSDQLSTPPLLRSPITGLVGSRQHLAPQDAEGLRFRRRNDAVSLKEMASLRATFERFDEDKSGNIDGKELQHVMAYLGHEVTTQEAKMLMRQIDVNGSGTLEFDEFVQLIKLYKEAAQFKLMEDEASGRVSSQDLRMQKAKQVNNYPSDNLSVVLWHLLVVVLVMYYIIAALYIDTLSLVEGYRYMRQTMEIDILITIIFVLDIAASLQISSGRFDRSRISKRYLRTFFWIDLLAALPIHLFTTDKVAARVLFHCRTLKSLKALITYFVPSGRLEANRRYVYIHFYILPVLKILLFSLCFVHVASIIFFFIRTRASHDSSFSYLDALYFVAYSTTGVGYGTIKTKSWEERLFACLMCLCAQVFSAIIVGSVVKIVGQSDVAALKQHKKAFAMEVSTLFDLPLALRDEIMGFHEHLQEDSLGDAYGDLIENLPSLLQSNIVLFVKMRIISQSTVFKDAHRAAQVAIAEELESVILKPMEMVFRPGDERTDMYFIVYGFVSMISPSGELLCALTPGENFGEEGMLTGYSEKTCSARCETYTELFVLSRVGFKSVLRQFPLFRNEMSKLAEGKRARSPTGHQRKSCKSENGSRASHDRSARESMVSSHASVVVVDAESGITLSKSDGAAGKRRSSAGAAQPSFGHVSDDEDSLADESTFLAAAARRAAGRDWESSLSKQATEEDEMLARCAAEMADIEALVLALEQFSGVKGDIFGPGTSSAVPIMTSVVFDSPFSEPLVPPSQEGPTQEGRATSSVVVRSNTKVFDDAAARNRPRRGTANASILAESNSFPSPVPSISITTIDANPEEATGATTTAAANTQTTAGTRRVSLTGRDQPSPQSDEVLNDSTGGEHNNPDRPARPESSDSGSMGSDDGGEKE